MVRSDCLLEASQVKGTGCKPLKTCWNCRSDLMFLNMGARLTIDGI